MAERGGFEPPVAFDYSRFPGVRVKPLCHLSTESGVNSVAAACYAQCFSSCEQFPDDDLKLWQELFIQHFAACENALQYQSILR